MDGYPVTFRTLDPPLHEFLPGHNELVNDLADEEDEKKTFEGVVSALEELSVAVAKVGIKEAANSKLVAQAKERVWRELRQVVQSVIACREMCMPDVRIDVLAKVDVLDVAVALHADDFEIAHRIGLDGFNGIRAGFELIGYDIDAA